jgi:hypothetical protein
MPIIRSTIRRVDRLQLGSIPGPCNPVRTFDFDFFTYHLMIEAYQYGAQLPEEVNYLMFKLRGKRALRR